MEQFLEETGYLYTVSALPGGVQRRINVEMLLTRAESFEKTSYSGLFHFIRYMEQLENMTLITAKRARRTKTRMSCGS